MQGASENQEVACKVSAAVAYHLLNACLAEKQVDAAAWLAKLDLPLLQATLPQPGTTIKVPSSQAVHTSLQVLCIASDSRSRISCVSDKLRHVNSSPYLTVE